MVDPAINTPASLLHEFSSILEPIDLSSLFPVTQPVEVELGCGDGTFLLDYAQQHPAVNFIGVERLLGRIRKIDRKGRRLGLCNLRGVRIEARYFLNYLLPASSVQRLHVYFPDPWPKVRHARHRLIDDAFPSAAARILTETGCVYLRTDDEPYFCQMQQVFGAADAFEAVAVPDTLAKVETDFEREFKLAGRGVFSAAYQRRPSPSRQ